MDAQVQRTQATRAAQQNTNRESWQSGGASSLEVKSARSSSHSHWAPEPGFEHIDGDINGRGYNETTVDVIAVPCIGASPVDTWARDPLADGYFELPSPAELRNFPTVRELAEATSLSPALDHNLPKARHLWIRQGIRKEVSKARVMLYRHRELHDGFTLDQAADDLLQHVSRVRATGDNKAKARPLFFICHSIGGLVAKQALLKACKSENLRHIMFDCHGITFFATPHRGSSYMSMPNLRESIQELLYLEKPLPKSITRDLKIGSRYLTDMHDRFADIASEMKLWTFYETVESQLTGQGASDFDEVHFTAPIGSIKSCLIGTRAEQAFSLESDHAHCASFGPENLHTMHSFLSDLRGAVEKAEYLSSNFTHTPLRLGEHVKMEIFGFYEDTGHDCLPGQENRLYASRHYLKEFLDKGPEECLQERLRVIAAKRHRKAAKAQSRQATAAPGGLGILTNVQAFGQRILGQGGPTAESPPDGDGKTSPEIVVTSHAHHRPMIESASTEPIASPPLTDGGQTSPGGLPLPPARSASGTRRRAPEDAASGREPVARPLSEPDMSKALSGQKEEDQAPPSAPGSDTEDHPHRRQQTKQHSRDTALEEMSAGFPRPDPTRRRFMWIHVPFNNPHWVKSVLEKTAESQQQDLSKLTGNDSWAKRHIPGRGSNIQGSYVKSGFAWVPSEISSPRPSSLGSGNSSLTVPLSCPNHLYLYMPYLHYDTYLNLVHRRHIVQRRRHHGRARPVPRDIAESESLEARVMWEYLGHDPPLNARRTLDAYAYPALRDTYARDDDQMLYKLTKERIAAPLKKKAGMYNVIDSESRQSVAHTPTPSRLASVGDGLGLTNNNDNSSYVEENEEELEADILNGNVLMIDQLWLWSIDTTTLLTFFPKRESRPTEGPLFQQADLRNSVYNELNGDLAGQCDNALDLAAFAVLHAVTVLLDRSSHPDLEIFRIFEEAIGTLSERMTSSLKRFRMQTFRNQMQDSDSESNSDSENDFSGNSNSPESIKRRHRQELEQAERENRENTSAMMELRDMDDELISLRTLFNEQQAVAEAMLDEYSSRPELVRQTVNGRKFLAEALSCLDDYKRQTTDMIDRVETTRKDYEKLQEMIQRQAQVDEVRWSRLQTELASTQNLSVMIFTTFTVIFLPLSFFTSLFGMNTAEWSGGDDDDNNYPTLGFIGAISLPASAAVVILSLILAFSSRVQGFFAALGKAYKRATRGFNAQAARLEPRRRQVATRERKAALRRQQGEERMQRKRERGYDFWETVRLEEMEARRRERYGIPELNRRRATQRRLAGKGTWRKMVREGY